MALVHVGPMQIILAGEFSAFAAMVELLFLAAYTKIALAATALPEAILRDIPATVAQRHFSHDCFGAFVFADPPATAEPFDQRFRRF